MTPDSAGDKERQTTAAPPTTRAALDRMVAIAEEAGMYDKTAESKRIR